ncbi:S8 family serine peptidase [Falsiroseomonas sp.]|uniref:S8 family serine peptidase n=1 Tax=Falsiroseomonas sp. TaxID=2870721 RepID=UPI00356A9692
MAGSPKGGRRGSVRQSRGAAPLAARPARGKLDPRLALLASLPLRDLRKLASAERQAVAVAAARLATLPPPAEDGEDDQAAAERRRALSALPLAPLTAGVILPDGRPRRRRPRGLDGNPDEPVFSVFILGDASARDLARMGVATRSEATRVRTAIVPRSCLRTLEKSPAIRFIELARPWSHDLAGAIPFAQIDTLHSGVPGIDGSNVIVGVIDSCIDIHHRAFRDAAGTTRLLWLWDQNLTPAAGESGPPSGLTMPGFPPGSLSYGVEYNGAAIDAELAAFAVPGTPAYGTVRHAPPAPVPGSTPIFNHHGSLVTGCAAGNGGDGGSPGAAPGSRIIFVSPKPYESGILANADSAAILDGCAYIFARAEQAGLPCVVNISMGDNQGPHDGTTLGEQMLDELLATPGRALVVSAGNYTGRAAHATGSVTQGATAALKLRYAASSPHSDAAEIWYDGHDRFTVTLTTPAPAGTVIGPVASGFAAGPVQLGGGVEVSLDSRLNDPRNGDNCISIIIVVPPGGSVPAGDWTIALTGTSVVNGAFHAWVDRNNIGNAAWQPPFAAEGAMTLGVPATARLPITVGNHDRSASPQIANTSGRGPTRDGRIKPEIAATGQFVSAPAAVHRNSPAQQPAHRSASGTSFSAPIVAGACALLFQCRGAAATIGDLKQILLETAAAPALPLPDNGFGFGFLQMAAACAAPQPDVDVWLRDDPADTGLEPFTGPVFWACPDIEVLDANGQPVANPVHVPGARFSTIIRVTARNRGSQAARNVSVFLYWADPATSIPFPDAWRSTGIYAGAGFTRQSNHVVIPQLAPGAAQPVEFGWAPPAPGSGLAGDSHFCLLARLEQDADPSNLAAGGFAVVTASNNIGLRNVLVLP